MLKNSALKLLVVLNVAWCLGDDARINRIRTRQLVPLSDRRTRLLFPANEVALKFRDRSGVESLDTEAHLVIDAPGEAFIRSGKLANDLEKRDPTDLLLFIHLEQVESALRATACFSDASQLASLSQQRPELRLFAFDLPPSTATEIEPSFARDGMDANSPYEVLLAHLQQQDPKLFSVHTDRFLRAPHIVVPLLSHLASLSSDDNLKFPVQLKKLSDQFRFFLEAKESPIHIDKIERNHLDTWADAQGKRYAFLDGGVAKIAGLPGTEPTALRVGIYCVRVGDISLATREQWQLSPFVVGDVIDKNTGVPMDEDDKIDLRRLGEAVRYTLEPLAGLRFIEANKDVDALFLHGPLINQFVQYDEGEPHFIPFLREDFLAEVGIQQRDVEQAVKDIPTGRDGRRMWRQFMAVYGYVAARLSNCNVPFVGVVERSAGSWLAQAILDGAVASKLIKQAYKNKVLALLKRYNISDDFLFGCVLAEGEYVSPTAIPKNAVRRAREIWQPVVAQYAKPFATVLKTSDVSFPFRVEMNRAGRDRGREIMRLLYHTARLLPRYAFPVGLDIVDKYAKVPDWLSRNISARVAAVVLNRAMAEGNARLVTQIRKLLAHTPRDFFYRPEA